ncbi:hypothetical protein Sinac_2254 [Singulisphaera acidiphila DSM 18658]|uniref:Uncharacterized protein n=1 Tax=Singulisphaera acidiphila (strain ATCC BAA-1392 / DSM 18658 / VKM B-2454 / MOB10) TaxID=886293 RepID=L0DBF1_SINAD|nr:hypothetical protein Sinac_2254 [Singulisphaera acidiphila DSM 18658]
MLTSFALWLVSTLIETAVAGTVGCQGFGITFARVIGRGCHGVEGWLRGLGQYGNSSFPTGRSPLVAMTRVTAHLPRRCTAVLWNALGHREGSGGGSLASLDDPLGLGSPRWSRFESLTA